MQPFDAGTISGKPVEVHDHGQRSPSSVTRWSAATRWRSPRKRASYGKDVLDLLFNRRLSDGQVHSPKSFIAAAAPDPQTFNSFYVDDKHVAEITTGLLPLRAKGTDPSLPTKRQRPVRVARLPVHRRSPAGHRPRATPRPGARWSTGTTSPPTASARLTTRGAATARWPACRCSTRISPSTGSTASGRWPASPRR